MDKRKLRDECRYERRPSLGDGVGLSMGQLKGSTIPILILSVFSLMLFIGICLAVIDPSGDGSIDGEISSSIEVCPLNCERYKISLDNASYNETTNSTNLTYTISVGNGSCGLESWFLSLGRSLNPEDIFSASPDPWELVEMTDQSGVYVINFKTSIEPPMAGDPDRPMVYLLEIAGNWSEKIASNTAGIITSSGICSKDIRGA